MTSTTITSMVTTPAPFSGGTGYSAPTPSGWSLTKRRLLNRKQSELTNDYTNTLHNLYWFMLLFLI